MYSPNEEANQDVLQNFTPIRDLSSVLVSNELMKDMKAFQHKCSNNDFEGIHFVQKYQLFDHFIESIRNRYFYMASPFKWDDPMETKYLEALDDPDMISKLGVDHAILKTMSIFCTCMTYNDSDNEEALWKSYGNNRDDIIRITYDFDKLCSILNNAKDGDIFVGKLKYKPRKDIITPKPIYEDKNIDKIYKLETLYVNNFCLKQDAYQYEKELRFCKVMRDEKYKNQNQYLIENIDLSPAIIRITLPPINLKKINKEEIQTRLLERFKKFLSLKTLCPSVSIHISNLYDTNNEEMTSEYHF